MQSWNHRPLSGFLGPPVWYGIIPGALACMCDVNVNENPSLLEILLPYHHSSLKRISSCTFTYKTVANHPWWWHRQWISSKFLLLQTSDQYLMVVKEVMQFCVAVLEGTVGTCPIQLDIDPWRVDDASLMSLYRCMLRLIETWIQLFSTSQNASQNWISNFLKTKSKFLIFHVVVLVKTFP